MPRPDPGTLYSFLRELRATGTPVVRMEGSGELKGCLNFIEQNASEDQRIAKLLEQWHREDSLDLSGPGLAFDSTAAIWGARMLFRAAWFYLARDTDVDDVENLLAEPMPGLVTPSASFSADLTLQWIPTVYRFAQTLAPGDPLVKALGKLATTVPLSCVGIKPDADAELPSLSTVQVPSGLWIMFIDRVVQTNAQWWLDEPLVHAAVVNLAGAFPQELVPELDLSSFNPSNPS